MASTELTLMDSKLLRLAANGKSAVEIYEQTGVPPEEALLRIKDLIDSRDVWDDIQREKLLMHSIYDLKERLEENMDALVGDPKLLESYRRTLELLGQRIEARNRINEADLLKVSEAHGRKMIHIIELGYYKARAVLARDFPNVDLLAIDAVFSEGIEEAAQEFEDVT